MTAEVPTQDVENVPESSLTPPTPTDPHERAQARLGALRESFASVLATVAVMYRDEDWKYLTREDDTEYSSLSEVLSDVMQVSSSMARRYIQAGRDFYLPLSEITVEGTRIEITSGDVATLGAAGLADAVSRAAGALEGVDDPEESADLIADAVAQAKARKAAENYADDEWESRPSESFDPSSRGPRAEPALAGSGATTGAEDADWDADGDDLSGLVADPNAGEWQHEAPDVALQRGGQDEYDGPYPDEDVLDGDQFDAVINSGIDYLGSLEDMESLPGDVQDVVKAFGVLASMDPDAVARAISFERRGALRPVAEGIARATRFRALAEVQPWMLGALGD